MAIWNILWSFGNLVAIFNHFGIMCQEKSGNPADDHSQFRSGMWQIGQKPIRKFPRDDNSLTNKFLFGHKVLYLGRNFHTQVWIVMYTLNTEFQVQNVMPG
jgi:hypothetical protein